MTRLQVTFNSPLQSIFDIIFRRGSIKVLTMMLGKLSFSCTLLYFVSVDQQNRHSLYIFQHNCLSAEYAFSISLLYSASAELLVFSITIHVLNDWIISFCTNNQVNSAEPYEVFSTSLINKFWSSALMILQDCWPK